MLHATVELRSDARPSRTRTSNARWVKAYNRPLRLVRRENHGGRWITSPFCAAEEDNVALVHLVWIVVPRGRTKSRCAWDPTTGKEFERERTTHGSSQLHREGRYLAPLRRPRCGSNLLGLPKTPMRTTRSRTGFGASRGDAAYRAHVVEATTRSDRISIPPVLYCGARAGEAAREYGKCLKPLAEVMETAPTLG